MIRIFFRNFLFQFFVSILFLGGAAIAQRLDAIEVNASGAANRVWFNDGNGNFTDSEQELDITGDARTVSLGDFDDDGDLDAFVGYRTFNKILLNDGSGNYSETEPEMGEDNSVSVGIGDLDGDGDLDAFVANWGAPNRVWLNDGAATFTDSGQEFGEDEDSRSVALGDLDGDGDLDAFVIDVNVVPSSKIFFNDGTGIFTDTGQDLGTFSNFAFCVALGDVDGDEDLDAFLACIDNRPNLVMLNDGEGNFTDSGQYLGNLRSTYVALGDLDGDDDLDAFVANTEEDCDGANRIYLNDGTGQFANNGQFLGSNPSIWVALGDLDEDGDLDAFEAIRGSSGQPNQVWLNDGAGTFFNSGQRLGDSRTGAVALGVLRNPDEFKTRRLVSHVADREGIFDTTLILANDTNTAQSYKFTPSGPDGEPFSAVTGTIPAHTVVYRSIDAVFDGVPVSHFEISENSGVQVRVAYKTVDGSPATIAESSDRARLWRIMSGNWELVFDGLALVNTGPIPAEIRLRQVAHEGGVLESATLSSWVESGAKLLLLLDDYFSPREGAYVEVLSSQPLALTALQGTRSGRRMVWQSQADPIE